MEKAIKLAIRNGWEPKRSAPNSTPRYYKIPKGVVWQAYICLDPLFWQALGKALGWEGIQWHSIYDGFRPSSWTHRYHYEWHRFIDWLYEGKDIESFFNELLK